VVRVKICGITNVEDALNAAASGADALGFVFFAKSPRHVTPEAARAIIAELPPFVSTVGLFVNEEPERVRRTVEFCGLDVVQLHGDEGPDACRVAGARTVKALRLMDASSLEGAEDFPVSALLLDAWVPGIYGGTGETCNWELAALAARQHRTILAGGLNPGNVAAAVSAVQPYGVDVSSGVESSPGRKDPDMVAAFIRNAKKMTE